MFYTETVNSFFHLYGYGYHHNHIDSTPLAAGTPKVDDNPVMLYLRYYYLATVVMCWTTMSSLLYILYMAYDLRVTYSFV
jgi:hypothetical protein